MAKPVSREKLQASLRQCVEHLHDHLPEDNIARRIHRRLVAFDYDSMTVTIEYSVEPWMANSIGLMHGGMLAMCADSACASFAHAIYDGYAPTVQLSCTYLRPVSVGDALVFRVRALHLGGSTVHLTAEVYSKQSNALIATCADLNFVGRIGGDDRGVQR